MDFVNAYDKIWPVVIICITTSPKLIEGILSPMRDTFLLEEHKDMELDVGKRNLQLVLVPSPFWGYTSPILELSTILHSKGFSITIIHTHFNFPEPSKYPNFRFLQIPDGLTECNVHMGDFVSLVLTVNANCKAPFRDLLAWVMEHSDEKIACVIYDTLVYYAEEVAHQLKLPSIILRTGCMSISRAFSEFQKKGFIPIEDSMLQEIVPGQFPLRYKDLPFFECASLDALVQLTAKVLDIRRSSAIIWNTLDCLEESPPKELAKSIPFFLVAPLYKFVSTPSRTIFNEDTSCISWLDKQNPHSVIYVNLDNRPFVDEKEFEEMASGLAKSEQPFLWVISPKSVRRSKWIELFLAGFKEGIGGRGCIVKWAPQKEVLAHKAVGGFWSCCEWYSTLLSIGEGVPMICRPCLGDQNVSARYISHVWKVGFEVENEVERGQVAYAIRRLMVDEPGKNLRENARKLKEKVDLSVKEGGSSFNALNKLVEHILAGQ